MPARAKNPEQRLIELVAAEIQDDERLLDGLGGGSLSLEDVESWQRRRRAAEKAFVADCGRVIAAMRAQGFGRTMRRGGGSFPLRARGMATWDGGEGERAAQPSSGFRRPPGSKAARSTLRRR